VSRRADVHEVDVLARDDLAPVGRDLLPAQAIRGLLHRALVAATQHFHARPQPRLEDRTDLAVGVAVRPAHERVADQSDVDLAHDYFFFPSGSGFSVLSKARTYFASASICSLVSWSLNGCIAVPSTPSRMVLVISDSLLPCFHLASARLMSSTAALPSAMWHAMHFSS